MANDCCRTSSPEAQKVRPIQPVLGRPSTNLEDCSTAQLLQFPAFAELLQIHVVVLNGGTGRTSSPTQPVDIAVRLANSAGGFATIIPVPAILGLRSTKEALEQDPVISSVLALAEKVTIACFTMEALSEQSVHVESGHLTKREVTALRKKGAIGDILGRFIDIDGEIADREIDARTVGLDPAMLRRKEYSICIAGGESKHRVILAGLRAGYFNVLITEEKAASYLLQNG